jgi:hypothetical protein
VFLYVISILVIPVIETIITIDFHDILIEKVDVEYVLRHYDGPEARNNVKIALGGMF